jgi:hypothetical protein
MILVPLLALLTALICLMCGPARFDAVDGAEFAVAGRNLDIPHPPGYPLFLWILRLSGTPSGHTYAGMLAANCILTALAYLVLTRAFLSLGTGEAGSIIGPFLFLNLPPVLSQTCILEVHALAITLVAFALLMRKSRAGPYFFSLAMFGGHPTSILTLPMAWSERFRSWWILSALLPLTLWLYVPLRSQAASIAHYTRPDTILHMIGYFGLYGSRLSSPSTEGLLTITASLGPVVLAVLLILTAAGWRNWRRTVPSIAAALIFFSVYRTDDLDSMAWLALLPLGVLAASGISRFWKLGITGRAIALLLAAAGCIAGIAGSVRRDDDAAWLISRDMLGSTGFESVYCTISHDTYYLAYLIDMEDYRPDILPVDLYGNYFSLTLTEPLPVELGGRLVYSTRAWGEPGFELRGLLFGPAGPAPDWDRFDIFGFSTNVRDRRTRDLLAEAWVRRALQQSDPMQRDSLGRIALEWSATSATRERISGLLENYLN